jgi:hypothetical protein
MFIGILEPLRVGKVSSPGNGLKDGDTKKCVGDNALHLAREGGLKFRLAFYS